MSLLIHGVLEVMEQLDEYITVESFLNHMGFYVGLGQGTSITTREYGLIELRTKGYCRCLELSYYPCKSNKEYNDYPKRAIAEAFMQTLEPNTDTTGFFDEYEEDHWQARELKLKGLNTSKSDDEWNSVTRWLYHNLNHLIEFKGKSILDLYCQYEEWCDCEGDDCVTTAEFHKHLNSFCPHFLNFAYDKDYLRVFFSNRYGVIFKD